MDALYPRLLVEDFDTAAHFWTEALRDLLGIEPVKVIPAAGYANWDLDDEAVLVLYARKAIAQVIGTENLPPAVPAQDVAMLVLRVDNVEEAASCLSRHGASVLAKPQDRPEWGANLRTAHVRTPDGTLVELQSY
ncbi:VOC family protein [Streptomyces triculaminicus]|uniref:VOC family protein n=2 Tax=Streptomyces TaxID=1883 RepID=A0A939FTM5_9ACTN|nr:MULTISPECIES: VOC family protein [Streptomyces]MBO0657129.1 VOC family protein [Streptomyces triculaminicus]QSY49483.1 VOC family protein [Streptomyces griseocarneus]